MGLAVTVVAASALVELTPIPGSCRSEDDSVVNPTPAAVAAVLWSPAVALVVVLVALRPDETEEDVPDEDDAEEDDFEDD